MAVAALGLAAGNAQARLGWTLEDCEKQWGSPVSVHYYAATDSTMTMFSAGGGLGVEVAAPGGQVQCVRYWHREQAFLTANILDLLKKNQGDGSNSWRPGIDSRPTVVSAWNLLNAHKDRIAYAVFYMPNGPEEPKGWWCVEIGTTSFTNYLKTYKTETFGKPNI
jgi:hypothetical protein